MENNSFNFTLWHTLQGVLGLAIFILGSQVLTGDWNTIFNFSNNSSSGIIYLLFSSFLSIIRFQQRNSLISGKNEISLVLFIIDLLTFYGLFSITLLPFCGIGVIQWCIILFFLIKYLVLKNDIVFDSLTLVSLISILYLIKIIIIYFLPDNIFQSVIQYNKSVKDVIFIIAIAFAVLQIRDLSIIEKLNTPILKVEIPQGRNIFFKTINVIKLGFRSIFILLILKSFIIVLAGLFLFSGIGVMILSNKLDNLIKQLFLDFNNIVSVLLADLLTTDNTGLIQSFEMNKMQWVSTIFFIIFIVVDTIIEKEQLKISYKSFIINMNSEYEITDKNMVKKIINEIPDKDLRFKCKNSDFSKYVIQQIEEELR